MYKQAESDRQSHKDRYRDKQTAAPTHRHREREREKKIQTNRNTHKITQRQI